MQPRTLAPDALEENFADLWVRYYDYPSSDVTEEEIRQAARIFYRLLLDKKHPATTWLQDVIYDAVRDDPSVVDLNWGDFYTEYIIQHGSRDSGGSPEVIKRSDGRFAVVVPRPDGSWDTADGSGASHTALGAADNAGEEWITATIDEAQELRAHVSSLGDPAEFYDEEDEIEDEIEQAWADRLDAEAEGLASSLIENAPLEQITSILFLYLTMPHVIKELLTWEENSKRRESRHLPRSFSGWLRELAWNYPVLFDVEQRRAIPSELLFDPSNLYERGQDYRRQAQAVLNELADASARGTSVPLGYIVDAIEYVNTWLAQLKQSRIASPQTIKSLSNTVEDLARIAAGERLVTFGRRGKFGNATVGTREQYERISQRLDNPRKISPPEPTSFTSKQSRDLSRILRERYGRSKRLSRDDYWYVREGVAENPVVAELYPEIIERLVEDEVEEVSQSAAEALQRLRSGGTQSVGAIPPRMTSRQRTRQAERSGTQFHGEEHGEGEGWLPTKRYPEGQDLRRLYQYESGEELSTDERRLVANTATNEDVLRRLSEDEYWFVRQGVARNPSVPALYPNIIEQLSRDDHWYVRRGVADNPSVPKLYPEIIERLSRDRALEVRRGVALNPSVAELYPEIIERLSQDDWLVRQGVAMNPAVAELYPEIIELLSKDVDRYVRVGVARNPVVAEYPEIIERLSRDEAWLVREDIARNPSVAELYPEILERLAEDENAAVSQAAAEALLRA